MEFDRKNSIVCALISSCVLFAPGWSNDTGTIINLTIEDIQISISGNEVSRMGLKSQAILRMAKRYDCNKIEYLAGMAIYGINGNRDQIISAWKGNAPKVVFRRLNSESQANPIDPQRIRALLAQNAGTAKCYK